MKEALKQASKSVGLGRTLTLLANNKAKIITATVVVTDVLLTGATLENMRELDLSPVSIEETPFIDRRNTQRVTVEEGESSNSRSRPKNKDIQDNRTNVLGKNKIVIDESPTLRTKMLFEQIDNRISRNEQSDYDLIQLLKLEAGDIPSERESIFSHVKIINTITFITLSLSQKNPQWFSMDDLNFLRDYQKSLQQDLITMVDESEELDAWCEKQNLFINAINTNLIQVTKPENARDLLRGVDPNAGTTLAHALASVFDKHKEYFKEINNNENLEPSFPSSPNMETSTDEAYLVRKQLEELEEIRRKYQVPVSQEQLKVMALEEKKKMEEIDTQLNSLAARCRNQAKLLIETIVPKFDALYQSTKDAVDRFNNNTSTLTKIGIVGGVAATFLGISYNANMLNIETFKKIYNFFFPKPTVIDTVKRVAQAVTKDQEVAKKVSDAVMNMDKKSAILGGTATGIGIAIAKALRTLSRVR